MKKKVTAPLTYDPGKGRPKEHLAYLNWQEMQALKRLNGNNQERGPKGLPSFPPADAIGSSSKASSSKSSGSKASTSKSTGSYTGGGKMGKSSSQAGAQKASQQGSNLGAQKSSSQASKSPSGKPSAGAAKASQAAEQRAQKAGTQKASAPKAPAEKVPSSGIKSLNVGPMGTPVSVKTGGTKIKGAIKSVQQPVSYTQAPRYRQPQAERMANPTAIPTAERSVYERMTADDAKKSMQEALNARIDRANQARQAEVARAGVFGASNYTGMYNPQTNRFDARPKANTTPAARVQTPVAMDPSFRGRITEAEKNYRIASSGPYASRVYSDPDIKGRTIGDTISDYAGRAYDAVAGGLKAIGDALPPNVFSPRPPDTFTDRIGPQLKYGAPIGPQRPAPDQTVFKTASPPEEALRGAPYARLGAPNERMLYSTSPATVDRLNAVFNKAPQVTPQGYGYAVDQQRMADEIRSLMERDVETFEEPAEKTRGLNVQPMGSTVVPEEKILSVEDMPEETPLGLVGKDARKAAKKAGIPASVYNQPGFADDADQLGIGVTAPDTFSATDMAKLHARAYGGAYLTPAERTQSLVSKGIMRGGQTVLNMALPGAGTIAKGAGKLAGAEPVETFLARTSYEQGYLRDLARAENIRYGRDPLGRESYTTADGQVVSAPVTGGIGGGRSSNERPTTGGIGNLPTATPTTPSTETTTTSGTRPYIYYQWDLGLNVPSPSDPNYTQYQKYLSDREARRAALGMT